MLSVGDVHGCLRKLETLLRVIKYPGQVDYNSLSRGDPSACLPLVSFTLTSFSPAFAEQLVAAGLELTGKSDLRFTDGLYKVLRDFFHYKPVLTKQQFLQWGFSQRKIAFVCDIIDLVLQRHQQLKKTRVRGPAPHKDCRGDPQPMLTDSNTESLQPLVVNHRNSPHAGASSSPLSGNVITEPTKEEEHEEDREERLHCSELEERLSSVEAQLQSLQTGSDQFRHVERRLWNMERRLENLEGHLENLERRRHTDESEGEEIRISRESWENLMSRVLLLETKQELSHAQLNGPLPCSSSSSSCVSMSDSSKEELKERLDRITNMLKSTSSLLRNTDSSSSPCK